MQTSVDAFLEIIWYIIHMKPDSYFADIKEMFAETDRMFAETDRKFAESDRKFAESRADFERQRKKSQEDFERQRKKSLEDFERQRKESQEDFDRQMKKSREDFDRRMKELDKKMGGMSENIGQHAEQYFQNALAESLTFGGEKYEAILPNLQYSGKKGGVEFDIVLVNGKSVAIIEAKNRIHPNSVKELVEEKLPKFRKYFPLYKDYNVYLGIAGFSFAKEVPKKAKEHGIGIIRQAGKSIEIKAGNLRAY